MNSISALFLILSTMQMNTVIASNPNNTSMEQDEDSDDAMPIVYPNEDHNENQRPQTAHHRRIPQKQLDLLKRLQQENANKANNQQ